MNRFIEKNRWVVLFLGVFVTICSSFPGLWSVFQQPAAQAYAISLDASALVFPMCVASYGIFAVVGGRMQDKMGPRITATLGAVVLSASVVSLAFLPAGSALPLYLCFSLPYGFGCALLYIAFINALMKWFADKMGFAMGLTGAMCALCMMGLVYLLQAMVGGLGLRGTMLAVGLVFLVFSVLCAQVCRNPSPEYLKAHAAMAAGTERADGGQDFTSREMLRTKQFYLLFAAAMFSQLPFLLIGPSVVTLGMGRGLSSAQALSAVALATLSSAVGQLILPSLADKFGRRAMARVILVLMVFITGGLLFARGLAFLALYGLLNFVYIGFAASILPMCNDMYGFANAGANGGIVSLNGTAASLGSSLLLTGLLPVLGDNTRFILALGGTVPAALCMLALRKAPVKAAPAENPGE